MKNKHVINLGFTLIEVIMVVSITIIVGSITIPIGSSFLYQNQLNIKSADIASYLRIAQISALSSKDNSDWGVYIDNSQIIQFKGSNYLNRDQSYDLSTKIPGGLNISSTEVTFYKPFGQPSSTPTITLTDQTGNQVQININSYGIVNIN